MLLLPMKLQLSFRQSSPTEVRYSSFKGRGAKASLWPILVYTYIGIAVYILLPLYSVKYSDTSNNSKRYLMSIGFEILTAVTTKKALSKAMQSSRSPRIFWRKVFPSSFGVNIKASKQS